MIETYFNLKGKTALVTGSTRGIGRAIAEGLIKAGCRVFVHGRSETECKKLADTWNCGFVAADFLNSSDITKLIQELTSKLNSLDILINNAGMEEMNAFEDFDSSVFDRIFQVNLKACVQLTHGLLPLLKKSGGASVVNVTSIHQEVAYPNNSIYCMSKAALGMLTKCLAIELAPYHIRVNNFAPGAVRTEINCEIVDRMAEGFKKWIPAGRVAATSEMTGSALYLCSDASSYTTGATLFADGGYKENIVRY